jgi:hypothetical protein
MARRELPVHRTFPKTPGPFASLRKTTAKMLMKNEKVLVTKEKYDDK